MTQRLAGPVQRALPGSPDLSRVKRVWACFRPAARRHTADLVRGTLAAGGMVLLRLALPWLLARMAAPLLGGPAGELPGLIRWSLLFLAALLMLGWLDQLSRVWFARFAIDTVQDVRSEGLAAVHATASARKSLGKGDLVARFVGDTTRIKEGVKGFLIHVATNGLLFIGMIVVLAWVSPLLSLVMGLAFLVSLTLTAWGSVLVSRRARKLRKREGRLAQRVFSALTARSGLPTDSGVRGSSGTHKARLTRIQGRTTWAVHVVLGVATLACVWLATRGPEASRLAQDELFVFVGYVLILYHPVVRLARQGTRSGKIYACAVRVEQLLRLERKAAETVALPHLREGVGLEAVELVHDDVRGRRHRCGPLQITFAAGTRTLLVGALGAGKSTLLGLLARRRELAAGRVVWDGEDLAGAGRRRRTTRIGWLSERPADWPSPTREALESVDDARPDLLSRVGEGLVSEALGSSTEHLPSRHELGTAGRRVLAALAAVKGKDLVLLDDPVRGLCERDAEAQMADLLTAARGATVIVAQDRPVAVERFDRVIELADGRVSFDGTPAGWDDSRERAP
ncbi:MAG: ATP-binding cassette domain-containing protein [Planctomycetota bacterium]|jgi:ABC-type multidrug transport system fused ATPase/permease subunit